MPTNILSVPQLIQPCYNPIYIRVSSDKTSEEAFNFIFDLYINGNFVNRDRLLPRPASTEAIYSPARILESYLSYDKSHQFITASASTNCIDKYEIVCGEEYVNPWRFYDNAFVSSLSILSGYTYFYSTGTTANPYVSGDTIYVSQDSGYTTNYYNGVFTVLSSDTTGVIVNILHSYNTPVNGGVITYSDRRKTTYTGSTELLPDPEFNNQAYWSSYIDADNNSISLNGSGQLNWQQYSESTFLTKYTQASGVTFNTGVAYTVTYEVYDTYPALGAQKSYVVLGGTIGTLNNGVGVFTENIICGAGSDLKLYGSCIGTGLKGITFNSISVTQASFTGYTFNGVLQYEEVPTWDYSTYYLSGTTNKFLTNQPSRVKTYLSDSGSIGFLNLRPLMNKKLRVIVTDNNNVSTTYFPQLPTITASTTNDLIMEIGVSPINLNQLISANTINSNTASYSIQLLGEGGDDLYVAISEIKYFDIDDCTKYEPVRFMFLNTLGQFDYFNANLLSRENININRSTYQKTLPYNYQVGDRGKTVISLEGQQTYTVTSNWITEDTCTWLMELFLSPEVYVLNSDGSLMPIIIDNTSVEPKKRVNDQLLNYTFNYTKAIMKNTSRN